DGRSYIAAPARGAHGWRIPRHMLPCHGKTGPRGEDPFEEQPVMSIATLLVVCLANDPQPDATTAILGASALGHAVVRDFDASLPANVDPRLDPAALPLEREGSGESTFSYTCGEAGYERTHIDDIDRYSDAFYLRGSFGFLKYFNVIAGIEREETNFDDIRVDTFELGGGAHYAILPKLDLVGEMLFLYDQIES